MKQQKQQIGEIPVLRMARPNKNLKKLKHPNKLTQRKKEKQKINKIKDAKQKDRRFKMHTQFVERDRQSNSNKQIEK